MSNLEDRDGRNGRTSRDYDPKNGHRTDEVNTQLTDPHLILNHIEKKFKKSHDHMTGLFKKLRGRINSSDMSRSVMDNQEKMVLKNRMEDFESKEKQLIFSMPIDLCYEDSKHLMKRYGVTNTFKIIRASLNLKVHVKEVPDQSEEQPVEIDQSAKSGVARQSSASSLGPSSLANPYADSSLRRNPNRNCRTETDYLEEELDSESTSYAQNGTVNDIANDIANNDQTDVPDESLTANGQEVADLEAEERGQEKNGSCDLGGVRTVNEHREQLVSSFVKPILVSPLRRYIKKIEEAAVPDMNDDDDHLKVIKKKIGEARNDLKKTRMLIELVPEREKVKQKVLCNLEQITILQLNPFNTFLNSVLNQLKAKDTNSFFLLPDYLKTTKQPMSFQDMKRKIDHFEYTSFDEFEADFNLIINNCTTYNKQTNCFKWAVRLREQCKDIFRQARASIREFGLDEKNGVYHPGELDGDLNGRR